MDKLLVGALHWLVSWLSDFAARWKFGEGFLILFILYCWPAPKPQNRFLGAFFDALQLFLAMLPIKQFKVSRFGERRGVPVKQIEIKDKDEK